MRREYSCVLTLAIAATVAPAQPAEDWKRLTGEGTVAEQRGDYARAAVLYRDSVRVTDAFAANDARRVWSWNALGMVQDALGNYADSELSYRRALGYLGEGSGLTASSRATILTNLGLVLVETNRREAGEKLLLEAVVILEAANPPERERLACSRNALAEYYILAGRYREAEPLLTAALAALSTDTTSDVGVTLNNLGVVRLSQGRTFEAQKLLEDSLENLEKTRGPSHPILVRTLNNLAVAQMRNRDASAGKMFRRAVALAESGLGLEHPLYAQVLNAYAEYLRQNGDKSGSRNLAARAAKILRDCARRNGIGATVDVSAFR